LFQDSRRRPVVNRSGSLDLLAALEHYRRDKAVLGPEGNALELALRSCNAAFLRVSAQVRR
jgi:hypothetical protein